MRFFIAVIFAVLQVFSASFALADEVIYRGESPDGSYVVVDRGGDSGVVDGTKICFLGADAVELFCAPVVKTRGKVAAVRLSDDQYAKVSLKMKVLIKSPNGVDADVNADADVDVGAGESGGDKEADQHEDAETAGSIGMDYIYGYRMPATFATPLFSARVRAAQAGNPWTSGDSVRTSPMGVGISWSTLLDEDSRVLVRGSWAQLPAVSVAVDYNPVDPANYAESTTSGYVLGLLGEYQCGVWNSNQMSVFAGVGAGLGRSQAVVVVKSFGGNDERTIAELKSRLHVLAATLSGTFSYEWSATWEFQGGMRVSLPLASFGASASGSYNLPSDMSVMGSTDDDLKTTVSHKKSSYGLELLLGAAVSI